MKRQLTGRSFLVLATVLLLIVPVLSHAAVQKGAVQIQLVHHDKSKPLRDIPPAPSSSGVKRVHPNAKFIRNLPFQPDGALQTSAAPSLDAPSSVGQFEGVGQGIPGYSVCCVPPDTNGEAGPNDYVQIVNLDYAVFNKSTGARKLGPVPINTLWSGFGGGCQSNNDGDPVVLYDQFSDRWIITQFSVSTKPYLECVAVSTSGDPTGSYNRFAYSFGSTNFPDYPKVAVWPTEDAYFITYNIFANAQFFSGASICAYQRSKLIAGAANTAQCFSTSNQYGGLLPADLDGTTQPAAGTDEYIVGETGSALVSWRSSIDWSNSANSTFVGPTNVSGVASFSEACGGGTCIPQKGISTQLDSLADRLMHRAAYRVFSDHQSMVVSHSVTAASSTGIRWYELRPSGSALTVQQQGTFSPDTTYRWMPSAAMDQSGNIAVGYSASSSTINPAIRYTGRLATDPAGTMQAEATMISGTGSQSTYSRWGDYSGMSVDPTDDCTFWFTTEYLTANGVFNWNTRIGSFKFSSCGGGSGNIPPAASFTYSCTNLACNFTDTSTDSDGTIASWSWNFGDNGTSTLQSPTHTYASAGTYSVSLTVTDNGGAQGSTSQNVTVTSGTVNITLTATAVKLRNGENVNLAWNGATTTNVDVFRNGSKLTTTANDGAYTDTFGKKTHGTFTYKVCNAGSTTSCSNNSSVTF